MEKANRTPPTVLPALRVAVHLLRHSKGGYRGGRRQQRHQGNHLHPRKLRTAAIGRQTAGTATRRPSTPAATCLPRPWTEENSNEPPSTTNASGVATRLYPPPSFPSRRAASSRKPASEPQQRGDNQRIGNDSPQRLARSEPAAAKIFQRKTARILKSGIITAITMEVTPLFSSPHSAMVTGRPNKIKLLRKSPESARRAGNYPFKKRNQKKQKQKASLQRRRRQKESTGDSLLYSMSVRIYINKQQNWKKNTKDR